MRDARRGLLRALAANRIEAATPLSTQDARSAGFLTESRPVFSYLPVEMLGSRLFRCGKPSKTEASQPVSVLLPSRISNCAAARTICTRPSTTSAVDCRCSVKREPSTTTLLHPLARRLRRSKGSRAASDISRARANASRAAPPPIVIRASSTPNRSTASVLFLVKCHV